MSSIRSIEHSAWSMPSQTDGPAIMTIGIMHAGGQEANNINYLPRGVLTPACMDKERICLPLLLLNLRFGTWY